MIGGPTAGNPAGHVAIGFTGRGVYSYGTPTPIGSSLTDYLGRQSSYRDTNVIIIPTTPEQEGMMLESLKQWEWVRLPSPPISVSSPAPPSIASSPSPPLKRWRPRSQSTNLRRQLLTSPKQARVLRP